MENAKLDQLMVEAANHALDARRRIELAVDDGVLPTWVMDACEQWEKAAMAYGAGMVQRDTGAVESLSSPHSTH